LFQQPCDWDTLVGRIKAHEPVIIGVDWSSSGAYFGDHAMVVYGVSERQGQRFVSIMNPLPDFQGTRYVDIPYDQACNSMGGFASQGVQGWRWVNTQTCSKTFVGKLVSWVASLW
jgi:hypothetical protein